MCEIGHFGAELLFEIVERQMAAVSINMKTTTASHRSLHVTNALRRPRAFFAIRVIDSISSYVVISVIEVV